MTYFKIDKILMGWLALGTAQMVAGMLIPVRVTPAPHSLEWMLTTDFLIAVPLGVIAVRSDWVGWRLSASLVSIPFAINFVNMVEGAVFLQHSGIPWRRLLLMLCLTYLLVLPLWRYIFGGGEVSPAHYSPFKGRSALAAGWRFVVSDFLYLFLYFAAGAVIWPYVKEFYATQSVPRREPLLVCSCCCAGRYSSSSACCCCE